jgi:riboflavin kinase/FMN adenylyltransferase
VRDILVNKLQIKKLVIGYDHQFGKNREGNIIFLKEICEVYGFEVIEIPAQDIDAVNVSSTKIRKAILDGNLAKANEYLGERFELTGTVVHGQAIGKTIGFPTANIQVNSDLKLIPRNGVYAVEVTVKNSHYIGMLNIGNRPTVNDSADRTIEVHILDFSGEIYTEEITVKFIDKLRDEKQFIDLQELQNQIKEDEKFIRTKYLDFT